MDDISALYNFNPNTYYFAYNNELSKDIGLDMSAFSNNAELNASIYRIHEPMPKEFYPIQNCRGIILKAGDKIIGAFISVGRHSTFSACSLKGNSFEKVTGRSLEQWIAAKVKADGDEVQLAQLVPEKVIEAYFKALANKNEYRAECCVSKQSLLESLTINMPNEELFNQGISLPLTDSTSNVIPFDNLKSATLLEIKELNEQTKNTKKFGVQVNLQFNQVVSIDNGTLPWDCTMIYESPETGWKIKSFGH